MEDSNTYEFPIVSGAKIVVLAGLEITSCLSSFVVS